MDAHVFRIVCIALRPILLNARIQKIYTSSEKENSVYTFVLFAQGQKQFLIFRSGRTPFLFLSPHRPTAGNQPGASTMRLRKYCSGQRIIDVQIDWPGRTLCLVLNSQEPVQLCLNLRDGAHLSFEAGTDTQAFAMPAWPSADAASVPDAWRNWPVLSPALRKTLSLLALEEQAALLVDLQQASELSDAAVHDFGAGDLFEYTAPGENVLLSAWPLPEALRAGRTELVREDILTCVQETGTALVFPDLERVARTQAALPLQAEKKRLENLLKKLLDEETRLQAMLDLRIPALLLQAQLYAFPPEARFAHLELKTTEGIYPLDLDMRFTVRENMARMFHQAVRGERGLKMLGGRREEVRHVWQRVCTAFEAIHAGLPVPPLEKKKPATLLARTKQGADTVQGVQIFRSSDGFVLLRGRDARGNARLLKLAAGHDIWCHTFDGPSAHVLIRRAHGGQEIPLQTLQEAGILAALKSGQKDASKVTVQYAEARHVRSQKGGAKGAVLIAKVLQTLLVACSADVETRLSAV